MKALAPVVPTRVTEGRKYPAMCFDEDLVATARHDPSQFVALYDRYYHRVHGYVCLRIANETTCEDVTSQIFLTALSNLGSFQGRGSFSAWLFRLARNAVYDVYRHPVDTRLTEEVLLDVPDASASPEQQALAADTAARLRNALDALSPAHQHLLALRFGAGLSSREIGRSLGKNPVAIRVSLHRVLAELRRRYLDEEDV